MLPKQAVHCHCMAGLQISLEESDFPAGVDESTDPFLRSGNRTLLCKIDFRFIHIGNADVPEMGDHRLRRLLQNPIHGGEELLARDSGAVRKFPDEVMDKIDCPILARPDDRVDFCKFVLIENRTNPSILFRILNGGAVAGGKQELQQGCSAVQQQVFLILSLYL